MSAQDEVVLDGELSLVNQLDGDALISTQIDGDANGVIKINPVLEPITVSQNGTYYPSEGTDGFSQVTVDADIEDDYEWRKPDDWPDLESVELPNLWDTNTLYFLYDKSCGIDNVAISGYRMDVYKGTVVNGEFIGELVGNNIYDYLDTLIEQYTVYKIVQSYANQITFARSTAVGTPSYSWMMQGCVWIYGELPLQNQIGGSSGSSLLTPYMKRMVFRHVQNGGFTFPANCFKRDAVGFDTSVSFLCASGNEYGDWDGIALRRTGNGPVTPPIKQKSDYVVRNVTFNNQHTTGNISARNVVLINPHGILFPQQYQEDNIIEKFVVKGGDLVCNSMYYQFSSCRNLRICDMGDVDFSSCTNVGSAFTGCTNLETLVLNETWAYELDLRNSPKLTRETLLNLFDVLPIIDTAKNIRLNKSVYYLQLTDDDIAIVTDKGWVVPIP